MKCPCIEDLPAPPLEKKGWPWTQGSFEIPLEQFQYNEFPSFSIVTPNYNYAHFLEETIRSILLQGYPKLEFIVLDAGSNDHSLEIIKKYEKWISFYTVNPGQKQASAINVGLKKSTGELFNWINSDDLLMPNALWQIAGFMNQFTQFQWITGTRMLMDERSQDISCELMWPSSQTMVAYGIPNFPQDATFFRRKALLEIRGLREDLENGFDSFLYMEALRQYPVLLTRSVFSKMRLHANQKTRQMDRRKFEIVNAIEPYIRSLPLASRWCYATCLGKWGPIFTGLFEEYRQWKKGKLLLNEAWYDLGELRWKLVKR